MSAPYVSGSATSKAAADSVDVSRQEREVMTALAERGSLGATVDELEIQLSLSHQSASARVSTLKKKGAIVETAIKRKTRSGRNASVYVVPAI